MTMTQSLLDFILTLLRDSDAKAAFVANPDKALADAGLSHVCSEDVSDAMAYVAEYHPVSFTGDRDYHATNSGASAHHTSDRPDHDRPDHDRYDHDRYEPDPHATAVHQLEYITNNYSYTDSHDTMIDKSVNQNIWNQGSLTQRFDDHSVTATDHSVAAGRDIDGTVANGDHAVAGHANSVGNTSYRDDHSDDHTIRGAFNGNTIADHGGVAGKDNDGNVTKPHHSDISTNGSELDNSTTDVHHTTTRDSFNDSHDHDSHTKTTIDSDNSESHTTTNHHNNQSFNNESLNHDLNNHESYNEDTAITHTDQHGLINANISPAINLPIHHNDTEILSHDHLPL
jgi:hypothetical protein